MGILILFVILYDVQETYNVRLQHVGGSCVGNIGSGAGGRHGIQSKVVQEQ